MEAIDGRGQRPRLGVGGRNETTDDHTIRYKFDGGNRRETIVKDRMASGETINSLYEVNDRLTGEYSTVNDNDMSKRPTPTAPLSSRERFDDIQGLSVFSYSPSDGFDGLDGGCAEGSQLSRPGDQLNGKQHRPSLNVQSKKKALALAQKKDAELLLGLETAPARRAPKISAVVTTYLASLKDRGRSAATLHIYDRYLRQFQACCTEHGVARLTELTADLLEAFQRRLAEKGYPVPDADGDSAFPDRPNKPRTARSKLKTIRQLIRFALRRQTIAADPAPGYYLPAAVKAQAYCWTAAELKVIFDHLDADVADLFHFLRMTGLRSNELCWLTKGDLDVDHAHVMVRAKTCPQTGKRWSPKHGNERVVPLCPEALARSRRRRPRRRQGHGSSTRRTPASGGRGTGTWLACGGCSSRRSGR